MPTEQPAIASGQFNIGGDLPVNRLGFGAMRITGKGIWGEPANIQAARDTLRRIPDLGINLIDTADSYGPFVSEELIGQTLSPYNDLVIATKGGLTRHGPEQWHPVGRPEYLRQCVLMSMRRLKLERIGLWQLHRIDPEVPQEDQFGVIADMRNEGLIRHVGLSQVTIEQIEAAQKHFPVATVQNRFNLADRESEDVLNYCETNNIGFIPWYPLAAGELTGPDSVAGKIAEKLKVSCGQLALAWLLKRSPVILPIPGTSSVAHLEENAAAAEIELSDDDFQALDGLVG